MPNDIKLVVEFLQVNLKFNLKKFQTLKFQNLVTFTSLIHQSDKYKDNSSYQVIDLM